MSLQIGIVGLPNVGKSTLFNALARSRKANVANYPFCTIDPNVGVVEVPDKRLRCLAELLKPEKAIPATVEFVDIAGLVKGASRGEGLGNKFLGRIRECHAVAQVVRMFEEPDVVHVYGKVDPKRDIEIIHAELILADLETLEKRLDKAKADAKSGSEKLIFYADLLLKLKAHLEKGGLAYDFLAAPEEKSALRDLFLLTNKPFLYIANVHEKDINKWSSAELADLCGLKESDEIIPISAKIEEELAQLGDDEAKAFLEDLGLKEPGLFALIHAAYRLLGYITFFTIRSKEARAWTITKGTGAQKAAGVIHSDFEQGFIAAEVVTYEDLMECKSEQTAREKGKMRMEGKVYVIQDGDVIHFKFN